MKNNEILIRLKRAEGQLRGIQKMVENDRYWMDIVQQIFAVQSATKSVGVILLEGYLRESIVNAIDQGNGDKETQEIILVVKQFVK